jgi:hypothetical protein
VTQSGCLISPKDYSKQREPNSVEHRGSYIRIIAYRFTREPLRKIDSFSRYRFLRR